MIGLGFSGAVNRARRRSRARYRTVIRESKPLPPGWREKASRTEDTERGESWFGAIGVRPIVLALSPLPESRLSNAPLKFAGMFADQKRQIFRQSMIETGEQ
jgi:hypothetical protein